MIRRMRRRAWCGLGGGLVLLLLAAGDAVADPRADQAWATVPEILARIVPPVFPAAEFPITSFGARPGEPATAAIAAAIERCAAAGGGRVVVPAGKFPTGPIHLRSRVELHLAAGAELVFSDRFEDYLPVVRVRVGGIDLFNYSPLIYAKDCTDVAVTGPGRLNGNAGKWWQWKGRETDAHFRMGAAGVPVEERVFGTPEAAIRPAFICFFECRNVLLEDFTIGSGPNWTIHPVYCRNVTVRGVTVDTRGPNNDGIDPDSCTDVLIENCTFNTGDDCIVLKSGYNEDGWRAARPTENVVVRHCTGRRGHGGLVIGSEMSGDVRNVFIEDCSFDGTDRAIRIKSRRGRGGVVENVHARRIQVRGMVHEAVILNMDYSADKNAPANQRLPVFRNMSFAGIRGNGAPVAVRLVGEADSPIRDIRFSKLDLAARAGVVARGIRGVTFEDVRLVTRGGPVFDLENASDVTLRNVRIAPRAGDFLRLTGSRSGGVRIVASPAAAGRVRVGEEVPEGAVTVE